MAIPGYQDCMLPMLRLYADGKERAMRETFDSLAEHFSLTPVERDEMLPSGKSRMFANRVAWARTYLKAGGLLEVPRRGIYKITSRGLHALNSKPIRIDNAFLMQYPEFVDFYKPKVTEAGDDDKPETIEQVNTPEVVLDSSYQRIRAKLASELLQHMKSSTPKFFEQLVVDVIVKMGYGGNLEDAGKAIGMSGDGGIDGVVKEDKLGLDTIYIQAKRWTNTVGRPDVQQFVGAITGHHARKGVFITTSNFSAEAHQFVKAIDAKVVLINGEMLAQLMIDHNVGVSTVNTYEIKKLDSDYFAEE